MSMYPGDISSLMMSCRSGNQNSCDKVKGIFDPNNQRQTDVKDEKNKVLIFIVVVIVVVYLVLKKYK
jgi:hypothetical protein